ncbi:MULTISPECIES: SAM-dependent methyltransferase [unclassified Agrococcus]|uniref:SAM-dependent methyltransferase n=1 Tax=unclassified Agrococcus TaxID=2615065 RepID=UPI00361A9C6B
MPAARGVAGRASATPRHRLLHGWDIEDEQIELALLAPGSRVLAAAGAGELVAHLAAAGHEVVAVTANREQLEYARRRSSGGAFESGSAERVLEAGRSLIRAASPAWQRRRVRSLLSDASPQRVQQQWRKAFDNRTFRSVLHATMAPAGMLAAAVQRDFSTALPAHFTDTVRGRIDARLGMHPSPGNRFAWRLLAGEDPPGYAPPVAPEGSIAFVLADALSHLEAVGAASYDAVTLSNVADGTRADLVERLGRAARRATVPGGPIVVRSFAASADARASALADEDRSLIWGGIHVQR